MEEHFQPESESDREPEQPQPNIIQEQLIDQSIPFVAFKHIWNVYFTTPPPHQLNLNLPLHKIIYAFKCAMSKPYFSELFKILDYNRLYYEVQFSYDGYRKILKKYEDDDFVFVIMEIFSNFQYDASAIIKSLSLILHAYMTEIKKQKEKKICLVIQHFPETNINDIKADMIQNYITFEAVVLKVFQTKLMPISVEFECQDCQSLFIQYLIDGNYCHPSKCRGLKRKQCKSKSFVMRKQKVKSIFMQRVKVQEIDSEGKTPKQVMCQLRQNMVGKIITGQTVKVSGVIKTQTLDEKDKKSQGIFIPYVLVNNLVQKYNSSTANYDYEIINDMKLNPNIFFSLLKSYCPTIYGHQIVKVGILLGIIGGSNKALNDQSNFRQSSHVLLLGDPGIGKSQLLKFAVQLLPHSLYVNATATSTSGLTVTVNRDNNQQSLQAGALILSDNGICAIDQFDKVSDSSSLLQAMQQQTVSIAKAGVICQLKCRVGIIASANPINGCYNKGKTFKDNTKISNAILSRFDLIFLLVDKPDPQRDKKLAQHIMKIHKNKKKRKYDEQSKMVKSQYNNLSQYKNHLSLTEKYASICEKVQETYSLEYMKKYLSFIKKQIHPVLSREACEVIKGFFLILRQNSPNGSFQITNRQLDSMIRLSMARARIQCRTEVTEDDAIEITQLMQQSLFDSFEQMGYNINSLKYEVQKTKIHKKVGELSLPKQRNIFIGALKQKSDEKGSNIWQWSQLIKMAKQLQLNIGDFHVFIQRLNYDGLLLQKGQKKYAFIDSYL